MQIAADGTSSRSALDVRQDHGGGNVMKGGLLIKLIQSEHEHSRHVTGADLLCEIDRNTEDDEIFIHV